MLKTIFFSGAFAALGEAFVWSLIWYASMVNPFRLATPEAAANMGFHFATSLLYGTLVGYIAIRMSLASSKVACLLAFLGILVGHLLTFISPMQLPNAPTVLNWEFPLLKLVFAAGFGSIWLAVSWVIRRRRRRIR